ncbi:hypothetical protein D9758_009914 [Tetrapyrgos nigripes]|uniref:Nephrocystin 3-like N-terminal domain-containing protein n=1 Tax=Tetrapyrgos nigripes TaxID=182062 RepID=A0A8H5GML0_9AGAR|nr:hypothetical protein D9758_009914 [Tetrapyrgos nigripes]
MQSQRSTRGALKFLTREPKQRGHPTSKIPQPPRGFKRTLKSKITQTESTQIYQSASLYRYQGSKIPIIQGQSYPGESIASERLLSQAQNLKATIRLENTTELPLIKQDFTFSHQQSVHMFPNASNFQMDGATFNTAGGNISHTVNNYYNESEPELLKVLDKLNPAKKAFHDVGTRNVCIEGTRTEILQSIISWAQDTSPDALVGYWMCGMAGTGKSTIAKSIQECKEYHNVIPTLGYQMARYSRNYAEGIQKALNTDPDIAIKDPDIQVKEVLTKPWEGASSPYSPVVVIDALDECENISLLLKHLIPAIRNLQIPGLKFFLTSRPEQHIKEYFDFDMMQQEKQTLQHFYLHNVQKSVVRDDISIFLQKGLSGMSVSKDNVNRLVESSGVLFIYAATIVKYLTGGRQRAQSRLKKVLDLKRTPDKHQTESLDDLYSQILNEALSLSKLSSGEQQQSLKVLHTSIITGRAVSCQILSELLELDLEDVQATIMDLQSVLYINQSDQAIYTFHASFADYMISETRAKNLYCNSISHHSLLAKHCLNLMHYQLKFNICNLPSSFLSDDNVPDIQTKIAENLSGALQYSCIFWAYHVERTKLDTTLGEAMETFFQLKALFWIEAMNLLKRIGECIRILGLMSKICQANKLIGAIQKTVQEMKDMANIFGLSAVKNMTPHMYLSIIPFYPALGQRLDKVVKVSSTLLSNPSIGYWQTPSEVLCMSISPDGERVVTGLKNGGIIMWNINNGEQIGEPFVGHQDWVESMSFYPDGTRMVSSSSDGTIRIWDMNTRNIVCHRFQGDRDWVMSVAISSDGSRIASGSMDETVRIWDAVSGEAIGQPFQGHEGTIYSVAFSPNGTRLVSGSHDKTIRIWDILTGDTIGMPFRLDDEVSSVSFSPDGARIAAASGDVTMFDAINGDVLWQIKDVGHRLNFSPDGTRIVSASWTTVSLWDANTGADIGQPYQGHLDDINSVVFSPDGSKIISGSEDQTVRIWDSCVQSVIHEPGQGHQEEVYCVAFSPDGARIISGSDDETIRIWDTSTGNAIGQPLLGHTDEVNSVAFSPDGTRIVSGSYDATVRIWEANTGNAIGQPLLGHTNWVTSVSFSPDGTRIVSGSYDKTVRIWDAHTGNAIGQPLLGHTKWVTSVAFSPDGTRIVSGSYDETVRIWDASTGNDIGQPLLGHPNPVNSVAFSPDGTRIVSGSYDNTVRIWDANTGNVIGQPLLGHTDWVSSVAFSPDGARIVSGSGDRTVRIWNANTGNTIGQPLLGHADWVNSVAYSPDGTRIASGSDDHTVRIWDATTLTQPEISHEPCMNSASEVTQFPYVNHSSFWYLDSEGWIQFPGVEHGIIWYSTSPPPNISLNPLAFKPLHCLIIKKFTTPLTAKPVKEYPTKF